MSFVIAAPEYVAGAATDLANIGSWINSANSAALGPTSGVLAAGTDEVSAAIAALFTSHAQAYQALSAAAQAFHSQFVQLMSGGAGQYALTEAANVTPLQSLGQGVLSGGSAPSQALTAAQPMVGTAASAGSMAAGVPAATAGLAGGSTPAAATAPLATAVSPVSATPAALAPSGAPVAAPALAPVGAPAAALQAATPAYSPAAAVATPTTAPVSTAAAEVQAETAEFSPATATAMPAATPVAAGPAASSAYSPATPPYSPATAASAESPKERPAATAEWGELSSYSA
jgi:PE family